VINERGLAGEAYTNIRNRILRGELVMGQALSRRKLAAELGMSYLPVSEALFRLEHDSLLESRPRAGTRVRIPTLEDIEGHYVLREALEAKTATLFAELATRDERSELMKLAIRVDNVFEQSEVNWTIYLELHEKLHRLIAECARCQALSTAISRVSAFASIWLPIVQSREHGGATHEKLMKVLVTADPLTVDRSMREHVRSEMEVDLRGFKRWLDAQKVLQTYSRGHRSPGSVKYFV
jgi:DNA-binding GntR family transcriptional regulator